MGSYRIVDKSTAQESPFWPRIRSAQQSRPANGRPRPPGRGVPLQALPPLPAVCRVARLDEDFLTKPFSRSELLAAVKKRLGT